MAGFRQLLGASFLMASTATVLAGGCREEAAPLAPASLPRAPQDEDRSCRCPNGAYSTGELIDPDDTFCGMKVCGRDFISYTCTESGWKSQAQDRCGDLACPDHSDYPASDDPEGLAFCGARVLNGHAAGLYHCSGAGQIPRWWTVCDGTCAATSPRDAECRPPRGACDCPLPRGEGGFLPGSSAECGTRTCLSSGTGNEKTKHVCGSDGWQDLGVPCSGAGPASCTACRGVQDSHGKEAVTSACGDEICGLDIGNESRWVCGKKGWLNLGQRCDPDERLGPVEEDLGRCPLISTTRYGSGQALPRPIEPGQTFCGGQKFYDHHGLPTGEIKGDHAALYACPTPGGEPVLFTACADAGGDGTCKRMTELAPWHEGDIWGQSTVGAPQIPQWDRCDERCPHPSVAKYTYRSAERPHEWWYRVCGQHGNTGRFGTLYYCRLSADDYQAALSGDVEMGELLPAEACANSECNAMENPLANYDRCGDSDARPAGTPPDPPPGSAVPDCDSLRDYQGTLVPQRETRSGLQVCGPGKQIYECSGRTLGRPSGWEVKPISCGTDCGECGPDPYGRTPPYCREVPGTFNRGLKWLGCDSATSDPSEIDCNDNAGTLDPAYCGDNSGPLGANGDPRMLYHCRAMCPRGTTSAPCADGETAGREYKFVRSEYCPFGCVITPSNAASDRCYLPPGLGFTHPIDNPRLLKILGYEDPCWGGHHLGQDVVVNGGRTVGAEVKAMATGRVLFAGDNGSSYHATVRIEHFVEDPSGGPARRVCSFYGHLSRDGLIKEGETVSMGQRIGSIESWEEIKKAHQDLGLTGGEENTHLHYVLLSDALCSTFGTASGAPCGYDKSLSSYDEQKCRDSVYDANRTDPDEEPATFTAVSDKCQNSLHTDGFISPLHYMNETRGRKVCAARADCE